MPTPHLALLRGVNVGGKNRLPMADLRDRFVEAGASDVRTYIQSGNVWFSAEPDQAETVARRVHAALVARGLETPVIVRDREAWLRLIAGNPFPEAEPTQLHAVLLADVPPPDVLKRLDPDRSPPDRIVARGDVVYLHTPNGVARTRYTHDWLDRTLATVSTARNWKTVRALADLLEAP